jgi:predicted SAM-dependent methyltransferase
MKLTIGPGVHRRPGWYSVEADKRKGGDFIATIPPLPTAVLSKQWEVIEWIHGITSVYLWDAMDLVKDFHSILAPGGKLVLEQPDFEMARCRVSWVFGDPTFLDPLHMNRWAYTPASLTELVHNAGFTDVRVLPPIFHVPDRDFRIEATK